MTRSFGLAVLCASFLGLCQAENEYPIILMHGVTGWGRDELIGVPYWGGLFYDVQEDFKSQKSGTKVYTVAMGPLSSNWDRVCEAFAQIKGTKVDYGEKHHAPAAEGGFDINRYGRDYTSKGLYPEWGNVDQGTGMVKKVHLLGHSMGGMDARMLTHLLNIGSPKDEGNSELFTGGHDWIASVTTLATPHDGSGAALVLGSFTSLITALVGFAAGLFRGQVGSSGDPLFDFKLDQFGLTQENGESFDKYFARVKDSALFTEGYKNTALWSLHPDGALETNKWVECISNVHYFSVGTSATSRSWLSGRHYPNPTQVILLWPFSTIIGRLTRPGNEDQMEITKEWWENDGVVSTKTADGPTGGSCKTEVYNGKTLDGQKGKFLNIGVQDGWDHLDITGLGERNVKPFYRYIQKWILGLKASPPTAGDWPTPPKGSFALEPTEPEMAELTAGVLNPGPSQDKCKALAEACSGDVADGLDEICKEVKETNKDCYPANGAASLTPVFGLVLAFANLLW